MKTVGIVCEYNPFHTGHKHQFDVLRQKGYELIICAMSGNYTQRGEMAIADKYTRAETAIRCGADIVVELPFPFSSFSAEGFAQTGVYIISALGADALSFGSESADADLLSRAARITRSDEFIALYSQSKKDTGSAKAYFDILSSLLKENINLNSNDILAISYINAIKHLNSQLSVDPIKREGSAYSSSVIENNAYPSATALRAAVMSSNNSFSNLAENCIPAQAIEVLKRSESYGQAPVSLKNIGKEIRSFFILMSPENIVLRARSISGGGDYINDDGCGIVERLCNQAKISVDFDDFIKRSYTSRYTDARINRVMLFSVFGITNKYSDLHPEYTVLLGASEKGRNYLSTIRKNAGISIITKPADAPDTSYTKVLRLSDSLYASAMPNRTETDIFTKKRPFLGDIGM